MKDFDFETYKMSDYINYIQAGEQYTKDLDRLRATFTPEQMSLYHKLMDSAFMVDRAKFRMETTKG